MCIYQKEKGATLKTNSHSSRIIQFDLLTYVGSGGMRQCKGIAVCIFLLLCLTACISNTNEKQNTIEEPRYNTMMEAYHAVLQQTVNKVSFGGGDIEGSRGILRDLNGDGQEEIVFYYFYDDVTVNFEAWTFYNEEALQLACVGDLPGIAGAGHPGVSLFTYEDSPYIAFWVGNSESYPPGTLKSYDTSCWMIMDDRLTNGSQSGVVYHQYGESIEIFSDYGITLYNNLTEDECQSYISKIIDSPKEILLGGAYGEEPAGTPIIELMESLAP